MNIDFVIPWVDGSDPAWRKEKYKYMGIDEPDAGDERYRDMGLLKYWFRAVEAYAPWVNQIHFITWGHLPDWLNTGLQIEESLLCIASLLAIFLMQTPCAFPENQRTFPYFS